MSKNILNIYYRETLNAVDSYEEYLSSIDITLDTQLWKKTLSVDNKMAYQEYLNKYPKGHYCNEVQLKINEFNAIEEREEEAKAWSNTLNKNTKASYEKYLMSYYNGLHKNEATRKVDEFIRLEKEKELEEKRLREIEIAKERIKLEKLEKEKKLALDREKVLKQQRVRDIEIAQEKEAWNKALSKNTKASYEEYLMHYYNGLHNNEAKRKIDKLIPLEKEKELNSFFQFCKKYNIKNSYKNISSVENLREIKDFFMDTESIIDFIPESIGALKKLEKLYIPYNFEIDQLPDSIGKLTNLIELNLNSSKLQSLPNSIGNLTKLESLRIDSCRLVSIPSNMFETLVNLKELRIYSNDLKKIPDSIKYLRKLKNAVFLWNMDIPKSFENLTQIEDLTIPPKALEKNPDLLKIIPLRQLTLVDESLTKMPKALLDLEPYTNIEWTYNNLNILENIKLRKLQASRILFASKNK